MKNPLTATEERKLVESKEGVLDNRFGTFFTREDPARIRAERDNRELVKIKDGIWLVKDPNLTSQSVTVTFDER